jgi:hypothetical protein
MIMKPEEAVSEAYRRWGAKAAICKDRQAPSSKYAVGYFEQEENHLVFLVLGSGRTLEEAFARAEDYDNLGGKAH